MDFLLCAVSLARWHTTASPLSRAENEALTVPATPDLSVFGPDIVAKAQAQIATFGLPGCGMHGADVQRRILRTWRWAQGNCASSWSGIAPTDSTARSLRRMHSPLAPGRSPPIPPIPGNSYRTGRVLSTRIRRIS